MASWIVHLRIAEALLKKNNGFDAHYFAIGNIAPDSGIPDENWENFEPPPELLHFRGKENAQRKLADLKFYRQYIQPLQQEETELKQISFYWGYFFHLVTDNLWDEIIDQPTRRKFAAEFEADPKFIWEVKRDWYGLDFEHVQNNPNSIFWQVFLDCNYTQDFLPFLPREAIQERTTYIKEFYQRTDEQLKERYGIRPDKYLSETEMDGFIELAEDKLLNIYLHLTFDEPQTNGYESALELDGASVTRNR